MTTLKDDALTILNQAIEAVLPEAAVQKQLQALSLPDKLTVVAIGKAAWRMANAAKTELGNRITQGIVITKYNHSMGPIPGLEIYQAGHPLLDKNGIAATQRALALVDALGRQDTVLFLVSGGGSALFEAPAEGVSLNDMTNVTQQLLDCGANIVEINTIRKHLSTVKGGRFAQRAAPANIISLVLSDVLGDRLDSIASGPAYPDSSTSAESLAIVDRYKLDFPSQVIKALQTETPKRVENAESFIIGSVRVVADEVAQIASSLGYTPLILTTTLNGEAREAGRFLAAIAREILESGQPLKPPCALILGGETVVNVKGNGKGGRNQELALAAAIEIAGESRVVIGSAGTDGTDGPTNAAGGVVDGQTLARLSKQGVDAYRELNNNNAYHALTAAGDIFITGPTGTNVNDISLVLVK